MCQFKNLRRDTIPSHHSVNRRNYRHCEAIGKRNRYPLKRDSGFLCYRRRGQMRSDLDPESFLYLGKRPFIQSLHFPRVSCSGDPQQALL